MMVNNIYPSVEKELNPRFNHGILSLIFDLSIIRYMGKTRQQILLWARGGDYLTECLDNPWGSGSLLIASDDANSGGGIGDLLKIPFEELVSVRYDEMADSIITIECDTTEGLQEFTAYDLVFIGDLREWCKDNKIDLVLAGV